MRCVDLRVADKQTELETIYVVWDQGNMDAR